MKQQDLSLFIQLCTIGRGIPSYDLLEFSTLDTIDETLLITSAREHKTAAALLNGLKERGESLVSPQTLKKLSHTATKQRAMRTFFLEEWDRVEKALTKNNIFMMTIKGPALSIQLYGNPIIREYTDLDIVVQLPDLLQILPCMNDLGYQSEPSISPQKKQALTQTFSLPWYISKPHHLVFINPKSPYRIEVHNSFFQETKTDTDYQLENIFQRAETTVYTEAAHTIPSLRDHTLLMIEHGTKHAWSQLHWVLDAAAALSLKDSDFHTELAKSIIQLGMEKKTALIISLLKNLIHIPIPEAYADMYKHYAPKITRQIAIAQNELVSREPEYQPISHILKLTWRYTLPLANGIGKKLAIGIRPFLVPPRDAKALTLPGILQPLHLLLRPLFVLSRRMGQRTALGSCDATAEDGLTKDKQR